jgi:hypothetical protein
MVESGGQLADDLAVHGLVLRHTIETGHGWGKSATPLHGFYVLDRIVPGVEDPDSNPDRFDDEGVGAPISRDVKDSLLRDLEVHSPIAFVSGFKDLIDSRLPPPVQLKGLRGFIALGPVIHPDGAEASVGVYFYAGGRWSRSNRYQLVKNGPVWTVRNFETLRVS